ncbi:hypothetical protein FO519_005567 [Halicephalobus sp. NKZ332]|nr:hypothetical protein FO519_005567 [Halicephalobus sp. NKZ332]
MATTAEGSLHGENVCIYRITDKGVQEISDDGVFTVLRDGVQKSTKNITDDSHALIIKKCCPGYRSNDGEICVEARMANPFSESQFSYAMIYLLILLFVVALVSMFIAYRYHYRFQRNKKHGLISNNYDDQMTSNSLECRPISPSQDRPNPQESLMEDHQVR